MYAVRNTRFIHLGENFSNKKRTGAFSQNKICSFSSNDANIVRRILNTTEIFDALLARLNVTPWSGDFIYSTKENIKRETGYEKGLNAKENAFVDPR